MGKIGLIINMNGYKRNIYIQENQLFARSNLL